MLNYQRDDQVQHHVYGLGIVLIEEEKTVVVRFQHGIEECIKGDLKKIKSVRQMIEQELWQAPWEVIARIQAYAIQSANDSWGVFSLSRVALLPHQLWVCQRVVSTWPTCWMVADDVGLGKTIEGGLIISSLYARNVVKRVLIVAPASLVSQWQNRLRTMFDLRFADYLSQGDTPSSDFWDTHNLVVASMETLRLDHNDRHNRLLESQPWDLLMVDEAHHLNSDEQTGPTLGYRLINRLVSEKHVTSTVLFTGTPHRGKNFNFLSLMKLLDPSIDPKYSLKSQLPKLPSVMIRNNKQNVTDLKGERLFKPPLTISETYSYSQEEETFYNKLTEFILTGKAYASTLSLTEGQVVVLVLITMQKLASSSVTAILRAVKGRLSKLHDKSDLLIEYSQEIQRFREKMDADDQDQVSELEEKIALITAKIKLMEDEEARLLELIKAGECVKVETKLEKIISLIKERYTNRSILFFTEYKATQAKLMSYLKREFGDNCVTFINGDERIDDVVTTNGMAISISKNREVAAEEFRTGAVRFLVSTEAGGEGIDLQENCHTLIHVDIPWNPMRMHQRVGRLNRYGQKQQVDVLTIRNPNTVESAIWEKLNDKLENIKLALNKVMGEPEDLLQLVLGMTSPSLFNEIYSESNSIKAESLNNWFDQKTAQFGGRDVIDTVRDLIGNTARFDFQEVSDKIPRVDLPDLIPFFTTVLQLNGRRFREENGEYSFKTPDEWITEPGIRQNYEKMVFDRNVQGKNAISRIVGVGQRVFAHAIEYSLKLNTLITTLPISVLPEPVFVFRVYDRVTNSTGIVRTKILAIEWCLASGKSKQVFLDWQLLKLLNEILESKRVKRTEASEKPTETDIVLRSLNSAKIEVNSSLEKLDLSFMVPEIEELAILWPLSEERGQKNSCQ